MVGMKSRDKARRGTSVPPLAGPPEHNPADADAAEETDTIKHWWATIGSNTADAASERMFTRFARRRPDPTDDGEVEKAPAYEVHFRDLVNRLTSEIFEKMFGVRLGDVRSLLPASDKDFAEDYIQSAFSELWVNDPVVKKGIGIGGLLTYRALARFR